MKTEQQQKIDNMMRARRMRLRHPGPRSFPKWTPDMSTRVYVMQYRLHNLQACAFRADDITSP